MKQRTILEILEEKHCQQDALAALVDGRPESLQKIIPEEAEVQPLTLREEEGRRVYERTLRFVLLLAVRTLYPGKRVRIEYSVGQGIYVDIQEIKLDSFVLESLEREMREIVAADIRIRTEVVPTAEAIAWYEAHGQMDKVMLLSRRSEPEIALYCASWKHVEQKECLYGVMAPSASFTSVFDLVLQGEGILVMPPAPEDMRHPAPVPSMPKLLSVFQQSTHWCQILGVENSADLSGMLEKKKFRNFIRVNEALHDQAIGDIARRIIAAGSQVVMVAGPSSSGKTTFAARLGIHLQVLGHPSYRVSLDDYYLNRSEMKTEPDGSVDLESIEALDQPLIRKHLEALICGEQVEIPRYNFATGKRDGISLSLQLKKGEILIVEGIHGLNPELCREMQGLYRVYISALTCLNLDDYNRIRTTDARLLRRIVRDKQFRGTSPERTLAMWASVRKGESRWIFPYQEMADSIFNSTLHYELPVLARYAMPLLRQIHPGQEGYTIADRLIRMLKYLPEVDEELLEEIPPLSLLREFIGGCTIEKE